MADTIGGLLSCGREARPHIDRLEGAAERRFVDDVVAAAERLLLLRRCAKPAGPRADALRDSERAHARSSTRGGQLTWKQ